jgi:hypothetical protein
LPPTIDNGGKPQINGKDLWQTPENGENRFVSFFTVPVPASSVGEQTGGEKLAGLLFPGKQLVKFFSPRGRPYTTKIGRGHTGNDSKLLATHRVLNSTAVGGNR